MARPALRLVWASAALLMLSLGICPSAGTEFTLINPVLLTGQTELDVHPVWSPNGDKIAFASYRDGNSEIYIMDLEGANPINLSQHPELDDEPAWAPDGSAIAFTTRRHGDDSSRDIYRVEPDGANLAPLVRSPELETQADWSPDGTHLAFLAAEKPSFNFFVLGLADMQTRHLLAFPQPEFGTLDHPSWSPDGSTIAFVMRNVQRDDGTRGSTISTIDVGGAQPQEVIFDHGGINHLRWSPDGTRLLYTARRHSLWRLFIVDVASGRLHPVSWSLDLEITTADWSPDGSRLVIGSRLLGGDSDIWVADLVEPGTAVAPASWGAVKEGARRLEQH